MVDDVQDNLEPHQQKGVGGQVDSAERVRAVRERREAEQRRRLDELRAHAAAAQAHREQRDADRRRRAAEQRTKEEDRRQQVEERKRAIWEAGVSRREALLRREREREERVERQRAARSGTPRAVFAFGSSTPRMLEPADTGGIFWGHRSTDPLDQMSFFESLASSTSNVMFTSATLTRRPSNFDLDRSERDNKDDNSEGATIPVVWSSVARRRTDLVPTIPAPRPAGRAYSMTRLDRIQPQRTLHRVSPSMSHLAHNKNARSGETTPGSRPGSAMSQSSRRPASTPRRPRPASIAGTPRGAEGLSKESTPTVSRDATSTNMSASMHAGSAETVTRRPHSARRPRPVSMHATPTTPVVAGEGKPPLNRKPKPSKDQEKTPSRPSGRVTASSESSKEPTPARDIKLKPVVKERPTEKPKESNQVNAAEVTQKLEALQLQNNEENGPREKTNEIKQSEQASTDEKPIVTNLEAKKPTDLQKPEVAKPEQKVETPKAEGQKPEAQKPEVQKPEVQKPETQKPEALKPDAQKPEALKPDAQKPEALKPEAQKLEAQKPEAQKEKSVVGQEKTEETDMTASMIARNRITTEEEAKAALAERRRKAREELERQAQLERERLAKEAEEEAERQRQEEERQRQLEEEARELAELQRKSEEEKLRKAIEAQQQLEREARERAAREEAERAARAREEREERAAREAAEAARRGEAEREEAERRLRKQRVEAIMLRTRKKAEEEKNRQENKNSSSPPQSEQQSVDPQDNGNGQAQEHAHTQGNTQTADLLGINTQHSNTSHIVNSTADFIEAERNSNINTINTQPEAKVDKSVDLLTSNVDLLTSNVDLLTSNVDRNAQNNVDLLTSQLVDVKSNGDSQEGNSYAIHNGHKENNGLEKNVLNNGSQYPVSNAV